jgi:transposase
MYTILTRLTKRRMLATSIALRARIILLAHQKLLNSQIAALVNVERHCVGRWRRRWQASFDAVLSIEMNEPQAALERAIIDTLRDAHRSGSPGAFSAEQIVQLVSIACENPRSSGRPIEDWTGRELADEMQKRSVVDSISVSWVNELLRSMDLQPHRRKYWCFTTEKDHELFQTQVEEVCQTYLNARSSYLHDNTHTICVDEMTSLQANEQRAETKRALPGEIAKSECQYTRHGTLSLTGSWDVVQGQMIHTTIDQTRNNDDFAEHIAQTIETAPEANWVVVLDNLNTHTGEPVVRLIASLLGIAQDSLGDKKKRRGILGSAKSRREFLTDPRHRIRFVFIPKHSSWLNQIEVVFGIIGRRVMRHGSFTSQADLREKLTTFIDYFNQTFAKPFNWTYSGKPTKSKTNQRPRTWREHTQSEKLEQILTVVA